MASSTQIRTAAARIRKGEIVAFPTETVYGLGANALDERAVRKIFRAKGRPQDNPLIVHITDEKMLHLVAKRIPASARELMKRFWPGPLTILFEKSSHIPDAVTAGLSTVAVRMPAHPIAHKFIATANVPIAAPSANKSGRPSPTNAAHVRQDFARMMVLDGGSCEHGLESTVVDVRDKPRVLRLGAITLEELHTVLPSITLATHTSTHPASPGMKYKHYSPDKPLKLFSPRSLTSMVRYAQAHPKAAVLCQEQYAHRFVKNTIVSLGKSIDDVAHNLFAALRTRKGSELIVLGVARRGKGRAIMERLEKAAGKKS